VRPTQLIHYMRMVTIEVSPNWVIAQLQLQQGSRIRSGKKHPEELKITHSRVFPAPRWFVPSPGAARLELSSSLPSPSPRFPTPCSRFVADAAALMSVRGCLYLRT
jgi:hypothetical protein